MKKRILCVILSLAAVFSLVGLNATQAWFSDGENKGMELKSGDLNFTADGNVELAEENPLVLPGEELELKKAIVITNTSKIDSELRIRAVCNYNGKEETFKGFEFISGGDNKWKVEDDGCIYYYPGGYPGDDATDKQRAEARRIVAPGLPEADETPSEDISEPSVVADEENSEEENSSATYAENEIFLAGKIKISEDVELDLNADGTQNRIMNINFIIEAKQADFVEWEYFNPVTE